MIAWYWCAAIGFALFWVGFGLCAVLTAGRVAEAEGFADEWRKGAVRAQRALEAAQPLIEDARQRAQAQADRAIAKFPHTDCGGMEVADT